MNWKGKFSIIMVALAFVLASAFIAHAQQTAQGANPGDSGHNRYVRSSGAVRVDRDFGALHKYDANQFGDDRAYTSARNGTDKDMDNWAHKWTPNTYGLGGDYGYDSGGPN